MKVRDDLDGEITRSTASLTLSTTSKTEVAIQCLQQLSVPFLSSQSTNWPNDTASFNIRLTYTPSLLVYAETVQHVQDAVACGVTAGLKVSARSGGHSYASLGLGGEDDHLIVDLTNMKSINVDQTNYIATVGAGARLGDVASGLYNQGGRAISHGSCPAVGLSGHILHGGYGWVSHNRGLALDWMAGADIVLANGTHVHCSETKNADLLWALRGAGSNFGIVTSYELKTFAAPSVSITYSVRLNWTTEEEKVNGVKELVEFARTMPTDLNMRLSMINSGDHTFEGAYYGSVEDLSSILAPLLQKTGGMLNARPGTWIEGLEAYAEHSSLTPSTTDRTSFYATSLTLKDLSGKSLTDFVQYWHNTALKFAKGGWFVQLDLHGGPTSAVSTVSNSATAYAHRDKAFLIQFYHFYDDNKPYPPGGIKLLREWVDSTTESLQKGDWGMYINYVDSQLDRVTAQRLYFGENLERLKLLKKRYDPTEVFYYPQSIEPAT
ncbi:hypothetical protein VMCG_08023 [Cytospora schulzeri]|uniref:FAD-binding PCMH-type domain-containing protein n=1 Tax=Cytospora schulzeri TaxID=448051 RepID=A0A423VY59_9PEZI|nr:hypothetical protein VMCG_08023 [Valsa malicola]